MSVKDILVAAFNKDATSFETAFSSVMKEKVSAAVENKFFAAEEYELDESKDEDEEDEDDDDEEDEDEDELDEESKPNQYIQVIDKRFGNKEYHEVHPTKAFAALNHFKSLPHVKSAGIISGKEAEGIKASKMKKEEVELEEKKLTAKDVKHALASAKAKPKETVSLKKPPFKMDEEVEELDEASKVLSDKKTTTSNSDHLKHVNDLHDKLTRAGYKPPFRSNSEKLKRKSDHLTNPDVADKLGFGGKGVHTVEYKNGLDGDRVHMNISPVGPNKREVSVTKAPSKFFVDRETSK